MQRLIERLVALLSELKRRKVYRVLIVYCVGAYAVLELSDIVLPVLGAPENAMALVLALIVAGFPIALLLGWMYDLTQAGLQRDPRDRRPVRYTRSGRLARILVVVAASGLLGWASWSLAREPAEAEAGVTAESELDIPPGDPRRIAVLYLDDHSEDHGLDYLAAGLTESLIHELSSVPGLAVSSRNAVKPFRGERSVSLDSILRALDVGSLVEGSVTREGDRLRATIQLIDGRTGSHLSSQVVEGPADSIFAFQDELADSVSRALRRRLGREIRLEGARAGTESQEAWELYQRAGALMERWERMKDYLGPGESDDVLARADSLLERARELDPDWEEPGVLRIHMAFRLADIGDPGPGWLDEVWADTAIARADRLLASHPRNARALELRGATRLRLFTTPGVATGGLLDRARADLERSIQIEPDRASSWARLSETLIYQNRYVEAWEAAERALEADVFLETEESTLHKVFYAYLQFGPFDEADELCDRGYERFPGSLNFIRCKLLVLGTFPQVEPDVDRAWELFEELLDAAPERSRGAWRLFGGMHVAQVLARAGLADSALSVLRAVRGDQVPAPAAGHEAKVHLLLGDEAEAVRMLERYLQFETDTAYVAQDWWYEGLHENPRFRALVGLPERSGH